MENSEKNRKWIFYKIINFIRENSNAKIIYGGAKAPYYSMFQIDIENIDYYVTGNADTSIIDIVP